MLALWYSQNVLKYHRSSSLWPYLLFLSKNYSFSLESSSHNINSVTKILQQKYNFIEYLNYMIQNSEEFEQICRLLRQNEYIIFGQNLLKIDPSASQAKLPMLWYYLLLPLLLAGTVVLIVQTIMIFFSIVVARNSGGVKEAKRKKKSVIAIAAERL